MYRLLEPSITSIASFGASVANQVILGTHLVLHNRPQRQPKAVVNATIYDKVCRTVHAIIRTSTASLGTRVFSNTASLAKYGSPLRSSLQPNTRLVLQIVVDLETTSLRVLAHIWRSWLWRCRVVGAIFARFGASRPGIVILVADLFLSSGSQG